MENVQRRATKFILNYPPRDVNTYRDRLISLNILPLEHRRELYDLTLLYKIKKTALLMSPLTNTLHLQLTPMPHATSTLTIITKRLQ